MLLFSFEIFKSSISIHIYKITTSVYMVNVVVVYMDADGTFKYLKRK
jgi:hypothetical protein